MDYVKRALGVPPNLFIFIPFFWLYPFHREGATRLSASGEVPVKVEKIPQSSSKQTLLDGTCISPVKVGRLLKLKEVVVCLFAYDIYTQ